uniref:Uncharacterized protein n=1 Tax=Candidatus Kentrum sp. DK TaxID=2126562 RepID=A0A450RVR4_9GAMM|nr:MAG: hypothetical protein BECKDK2373B_GA0170837_100512 [Candidatus Kentron sp. DK]
MIRSILAALAVYTLSLWLFPTSHAGIFYGFVAVTLLLSLSRRKDGCEIPGVIPGFVLLACASILLIYFLTATLANFMHLAWLFAGVYCGLVLLLRLALGRAPVRIAIGLVTVLVFSLESRYYTNPGYTVDLNHSLALLATIASPVAWVTADLLRRVLARIPCGSVTGFDPAYFHSWVTRQSIKGNGK